MGDVDVLGKGDGPVTNIIVEEHIKTELPNGDLEEDPNVDKVVEVPPAHATERLLNMFTYIINSETEIVMKDKTALSSTEEADTPRATEDGTTKREGWL